MSADFDAYINHARSPGDPARRAVAVTPADGADLTVWAKALYLGQGGDLRITPAGGTEAVTLKGHPAGYAAVQARRVWATGTTAAHIVALFD
ncbi:hypothetical protein GVN24_34245 [Rhizobium sp. CRIBSB]|nr:hypothetical protein [Rhizobium sp. CRIBSB]